jgi:hypothetical protein
MPAHLEPQAEQARKRHRKRHANPGVAIEVVVEKVTECGYRLASPHSDTEAWQAMVCDAFGTRSEANALTFLHQLAALCQRNWHTDEAGGGEWCPDECQLNMILNMVAGIQPRNEMEAALAAQMVAVHMLMMGVSERALRTFGCADPHLATAAGKLARTFAIQNETLAKLRGGKTSRQSIKVSHEKHVHQHQHVHVHRGEEENGGQPHAAMEGRIIGNVGSEALPSSNAPEGCLHVSSSEGAAGLPNARRERLRSAKGSR